MSIFQGRYDVAIGSGETRETGAIKLMNASSTVSHGGEIHIPLMQYRRGGSYAFKFEENGIDFEWLDQHAKTINGGPDGYATFVLEGLPH